MMTKQEQFFFDNAGFSYRPGEETPDQARLRCSKEYAVAETWALQEGYTFTVEPDQDADESWLDSETEEYQDEWRGKGQSVAMWTPDGAVCQSVGGCYGDAKYMRVVKAELALEQMQTCHKTAAH